MSLRVAKKQRQRAELLENAVALFREHGSAGARVREIAQRCQVSEATFFNYFASKDRLLGEWAHLQVELALEASLPPQERSLRLAVRVAATTLATNLESDRVVAVLTFARAEVHPPPESSPGRVSRTNWIERLRAEQRTGALRADIPTPELAALLHGSLLRAAADALAQGATPLAPILTRAADLVADGARKRHERVRPRSNRNPVQVLK